MKKSIKWIIGIILSLLVICGSLLFIIKNKEYQPTKSAENAATSSVTVDNTIKFQGDDSKPWVIFYPGALVAPKSYSL